MRANGYEAGRDPILRPLDTIECRDAILNEDGREAEWRDASALAAKTRLVHYWNESRTDEGRRA
jgi:hypothetical protein